jgi:hypothetical protein
MQSIFYYFREADVLVTSTDSIYLLWRLGATYPKLLLIPALG